MNNIVFQNSYLRNNYHNTGLDMQNKLEMMRIFCVAAESRNFKEAATQLGISPQVVTRAIKELEEQRGEILFYRSTRQIKITADGERLANICFHNTPARAAATHDCFIPEHAHRKTIDAVVQVWPLLSYTTLLSKI